MNFIKTAWERIVKFNSTRLVSNLLTMPDDEFTLVQNQTFDNAKRVSDFVGMIVRLAFVMFALIYFFRTAPKADGFIGFALGVCAIACIGILYVLGREIFFIIFLWEVRNTRKTPAGFTRTILFVGAAFFTLCIYFALYELVSAIAQSNALLASA